MTEQPTSKAKRRYAREPKKPADASATAQAIASKDRDAPVPPRETKIGKVIALLERKDGATLDEMVTATGWQPHTTRAALTGLRKKGRTIERDKRDDATCYRITKGA